MLERKEIAIYQAHLAFFGCLRIVGGAFGTVEVLSKRLWVGKWALVWELVQIDLYRLDNAVLINVIKVELLCIIWTIILLVQDDCQSEKEVFDQMGDFFDSPGPEIG